jgi:hypothetical protein
MTHALPYVPLVIVALLYARAGLNAWHKEHAE